MRNSIGIFDINGKDGIVARASMRNQDPEQILLQKVSVPKTQPIQANIIGMVSYVMNIIKQNGDKDKTYIGRYTIIVPETVALRMFQLVKVYKQTEGNVEEMVDAMFLNWMHDEQYDIEEEGEDDNGDPIINKYNIWEASINDLCVAYVELMRNGYNIQFVNARTLYRWEIFGEGLHRGMQVDLVNGINEELGIACNENTMLTGTFEVTQTDIRDRNGNVRSHFYIPRTVAVQQGSDDGVNFDRITMTELMERNFDVNPHYDNGIALCNAVKLRMENAKQLPRIKAAKNITVKTVAQGSAEF